MKSRNSKIIVLLLLIGLFLTGCGKKEESDTKKPSNDNQNQTDVKNLKIVDANSKSRPYAVMINNISVARPLQSGLQDAYLMYEIIVEGGITRYMALFMDQNTTRIGSIRSARHYFLDYALENDAIYVHHGQSPQAQSDFSALGVDRIVVDNSKTGWRDKSLKVASEHTLFTSIEKLNNGYDAENGYYLRSVNGKAHTDYVTKKQYHFKNIITYQVKNTTLNDGENKGRQNIENVGSGTGYYISGGYSVPIKWVKESRKSQTKYYYMNGEELKVNDGNTFIQIEPVGQKLSIS